MNDITKALKIYGLERNKILACLVGSHNYNLNDENSDRDYKVFVTPTFDDLYSGSQYTVSKIGKNIDFEIHDIRKLSSLIWKANINFIEVLFSEEQFVEHTLEGNHLSEIIKKRNELARMNLPYLWDACMGMHYNKFKLLQKGTSGTQYLVDKFGYDTKQAQHCYRVLNFLERYYNNNFNDFKQAIWYNNGEDSDSLIDIKNGKYTLSEFIEIVQNKKEDISKLKEHYKSYKPDIDLYMWLNKQIKEIVKISLYKDLKR